MRNFEELFSGIKGQFFPSQTPIFVRQLTTNSAQTQVGDVFFAVRGTAFDGHDFIEDAVQNGAVAVVAEKIPEKMTGKTAFFIVSDVREALGLAAAAFFDFPARRLKLVGVTGTNGKTTTATLLFDLFKGLGYSAALLSTVKNQINEEILPSTHTTPDVISLNKLLKNAADAGCEYVFMEVSSHGIDQKRIFGLDFAGGIFTNITHDHLDYHKTFAAYIKAKKAFFDSLSQNAFALVNADDKNSEVMLQNCAAKTYRFGTRTLSDFHAKIKTNSFEGLCLQIGKHEVWFRIIGEFNASNLLAVYGAAVLLGQDEAEVLRVLSGLRGAEGRLEVYTLSTGAFAVIDYAHTPDALENVLQTLRDVRFLGQKIITLVGCGGNRDKEKRPKMARTAFLMSDLCIFTSDNPRNEKPEDILSDMYAGVKDFGDRSVLKIIEERGKAIEFACQKAQKNDIILIAGKGHENYQEIAGVKQHFSDKEEVLKF